MILLQCFVGARKIHGNGKFWEVEITKMLSLGSGEHNDGLIINKYRNTFSSSPCSLQLSIRWASAVLATLSIDQWIILDKPDFNWGPVMISCTIP